MRQNNKDVAARSLRIGTEVSQGIATFIFMVHKRVEECGETRFRQTLTPIYQATCRSHPRPQSLP